MYIPRHYQQPDREKAIAFMEGNSFAILCTNGSEVPGLTHVPVLVEKRGETLRLFGHIARANEHLHDWKDGSKATIIFHGPHAYVSSSWYEKRQNVPTWNYLAVHAHGSLSVIEGEVLRADLETLMTKFEANQRDPRALADQDPEYIDRLMRGVIGFELIVDKLDAKAKISQNKSEKDREEVIQRLEEADEPIAKNMREHYDNPSAT